MRLPLGLILPAVLLAVGCHRNADGPPMSAAPAAISVNTVQVEARPMPKVLPLTGSLIANQSAGVAANASGRVLKTFVERGSLVKAGAPLIQLDSRSASLGQAEARANLRNAQTQAQLSDQQCARNQELFRRGAISKDEWERQSSQCLTSAGSADAARARADNAQHTLSDATVRAPFAGMVSERSVNVGEYVQPSTRVLTLVEVDPLRLQLTVSEADVGRVHEEQVVQFEVDAYPNELFSGTVKYIDPTVRTATRDMVVEATVPNTDRRLRPGMFASARLTLPEEPLPTVPKTSLRPLSDVQHLFTVVDGHIEERIVQIGPTKDDMVAVLQGVKPGDKVVINPGDTVKDGLQVK